MATPKQPQSPPASQAASGFSGAFQPMESAITPDDKAYVPVAGNWPGMLYNMAEEWSVQDLGEEIDGSRFWWVPTMTGHRVRPGINVNRTINRDREKPSAAYDQQVMRMQRIGAQYAFPDDPRTRLPDGRPYRVSAACKHPRTNAVGTFYTEAFATPRTYRRGKRLKFDWDRQARYRWCRLLVVRGVVRPIEADVMRHYISLRLGEVERIETNADKTWLERESAKKREIYEQWRTAKVPQHDVKAEAEARGTLAPTGSAASSVADTFPSLATADA